MAEEGEAEKSWLCRAGALAHGGNHNHNHNHRQRGAARTHKTGRMRTSDVPVLSAAGLIVALSAPLGCAAAYISAVDVGPVEWVCETTCLDIVGPWAEGGGATRPEAKSSELPPSFKRRPKWNARAALH